MIVRFNLKEIVSIGGKCSIYRPNGSTNCISLTKLLKKINFSSDQEKKLIYLTYSNSSQIQAVYIILDPNDENSKLKEIYNKLDEI